MKHIYIDVDSTLNNHWVRIQKWALPSFPGTSIDHRAFTREELMKDEPLDYAKEALDDLSQYGKIHILSARNFQDAEKITEDWLVEHDFKFDTVNIVAKSIHKPPFLKDKQVDLFVDDFSAGQEFGDSYVNLYKDTLLELDDMEIPYIVFNGDWKFTLDIARSVLDD